MKRIIYTAVALITCASVFGIADYFNAKKQGALVNYTDEVQTPEAIISEKKPEAMPAKEKVLLADTKKQIKHQAASEKKISNSKEKNQHFTEMVPNVAVTDKTKESVTGKVDPVAVLQSKTTGGDDTTVQVETKRKISMEMFSRAPIREKKIKAKK